jgi:hypothetical protein
MKVDHRHPPEEEVEGADADEAVSTIGMDHLEAVTLDARHRLEMTAIGTATCIGVVLDRLLVSFIVSHRQE